MKFNFICRVMTLTLALFFQQRADAYHPVMITSQQTVTTIDEFCKLVTENQEHLKSLLDAHGAILFRHFPIQTGDDFSRAITAILGREPTKCRASEESRHRVAPGVYISTDEPAEFHIPLHHELSCIDSPLSYVAFFCEIPPVSCTGQTLIASTESVNHRIVQESHIWDLFDGKIIKYTSRHPPEGSFFCAVNPTHKTWQEVFETDNPAVVEMICREKGFEFQWLGDWLEVVRRAPAIRAPDKYFDHPYWFNQADLYHPNPRIRGSWLNHILATILYIVPSTRPYEVEFDDGSAIPQEALYTVYDILEDETVRLEWQEGDLLVLNNIKTLHGKAPHEGPRRVLVARFL